MPKGQIYDTDLRRQVADMQRAGVTIRQITAATGVPKRTVYRWLNWPHAKVYGEKNGHND